MNAFVNRDALQMGEEGRHALETLYQRACLAGIIQQVPPLDIVGRRREEMERPITLSGSSNTRLMAINKIT